MNCYCEVIIDKPIQQVWDYANNPEHLKLWLNDFVRYEQVSGDVTAPKIGDIANHTYDQNGKEFTMKETIVAYNPPNHIKLFMTSGWFDMEIVNDLEAVSDNQTKLIAAADTVRTSLIMKIMMLFMSKTKMQKDHEMQINKLKELIEAN
jgi:uncharacterized protein YndB with AHSA1/START domain